MEYRLDTEEAVYYLLSLRTAEKQYQNAKQAFKPVAMARLKKATADADNFLKAYIKMKKEGTPINEPVNQDFGSADKVLMLVNAAKELLSDDSFVAEARESPIGIARHDKDSGLDYVLHFEKPSTEEVTKAQATEEEILGLIYSERDSLSNPETIIISGRPYKVRRTDDGQIVDMPGEERQVLILPDGSTKNL